MKTATQPQCNATTSAGKRCSRKKCLNHSAYCAQHAGKTEGEQSSDPTTTDKQDKPSLTPTTTTGTVTPATTPMQTMTKGGQHSTPSPADYGAKPVTGLAAKIAPTMMDDTPHVEVPALAGTGKTTTIIGGVCELKGQPMELTPSDQQRAVWEAMKLGRSDSIRISAFNTKITDTIKDRIVQQGLDKKGVEARGIHSLGNGTCFKAFGKVAAKDYAVTDLVAKTLGTNYKEARHDPKLSAKIRATDELVSLCKQTLTDPTPENLDKLSSHYDVEVNGQRDDVYDLVPDILEKCKKPKELMHFDDMVWLPIVHNLPIYKVDVQIVDESQDLNKMQQELMFRAGRRMIFVGDMNQAIYGFAGADAESMNNMRRTLIGSHKGCVSLPLTMTRRCGRAIVKEAQRYVPSFQAHESNPEGVVRHASILKESPNAYHRSVQDGDMVLCRTNAPLVTECFRLLAMGKKANILGRKIGDGLVSLVDKSKKHSTPDLIAWLGDWLQKETANEQAKKFPSDNRITNLQDRHDCIVSFCSGLSTVEDVKRKIDSIFTDNKQKLGVTFSSIHKSKGLEADNIFFLQPKGAGPRRDKMQAWELKQEDNLSYVAITRAIKELTYVY